MIGPNELWDSFLLSRASLIFDGSQIARIPRQARWETLRFSTQDCHLTDRILEGSKTSVSSLAALR